MNLDPTTGPHPSDSEGSMSSSLGRDSSPIASAPANGDGPIDPIKQAGRLMEEWGAQDVSPGEARAWILTTGWTVSQAQPWREAQFSPEQARFADTLLAHAEFTTQPDSPLSDATEWLGSELTPEWVCRCIAFGCPTVAEGRAMFEQADLDSGLRTRMEISAFAAGADSRSYRIEAQALGWRMAFGSPYDQLGD